MSETKLRQTIVATNPHDIERTVECSPGVSVAQFSGDWGMGCGGLHIGVDRASLNRYDVELLIAWLTRNNWPTGFDPVVMEASFPTLSRDDVRQLAALFQQLGDEMDAWEYQKQEVANA